MASGNLNELTPSKKDEMLAMILVDLDAGSKEDAAQTNPPMVQDPVGKPADVPEMKLAGDAKEVVTTVTASGEGAPAATFDLAPLVANLAPAPQKVDAAPVSKGDAVKPVLNPITVPDPKADPTPDPAPKMDPIADPGLKPDLGAKPDPVAIKDPNPKSDPESGSKPDPIHKFDPCQIIAPCVKVDPCLNPGMNQKADPDVKMAPPQNPHCPDVQDWGDAHQANMGADCGYVVWDAPGQFDRFCNVEVFETYDETCEFA
ncbi:MAG: hypothetical protein HRU27_17330 [Rhizobiaceae bacterium]|nr:hypothetical protein [Hyphomicrobiales bacterium]NRB32356.1 hypothetical protein [Rhizobiaceae bacterium]